MNRFTALSLCTLLLTTACHVGEITPDMPATPAQWSAPNAQKTTPADAAKLKEWWKQFNDPTLNWLIEQALKENPDVRQAAARIDEARGEETTAFAALFPKITGQADANRARQLFFTPVEGNTGDATFNASWELDLFGKNRDASKAADLATMAASKDYEWIKLSMIADVARNYIAMRAAEKQIALAQKNLATERDTLNLTSREYKAGGSSNFDVERTGLQVNQSTAKIADYTRQKEIFELALMTLTGMPVNELRAHIPPAKEIPGIGLEAVADSPASVLAHRPDIAAANLRLAQSTSLKESQAAAIYPSISLSGLYGLSKTIIVDTSTVWSFGATASVNLLDFGRIQGQIDAASAREVQAYETWRKAILTGINDVESALTNVSRLQEQRIALGRAHSNAIKALNFAKIRYKAGDASLLDTLDAQRQAIEADSALVDAENNYVTAVIALYKALGQY